MKWSENTNHSSTQQFTTLLFWSMQPASVSLTLMALFLIKSVVKINSRRQFWKFFQNCVDIKMLDQSTSRPVFHISGQILFSWVLHQSVGTHLWKLGDAKPLYGTCNSSALWKYHSPPQEDVITCNAYAFCVWGTFSASVFGFNAVLKLHSGDNCGLRLCVSAFHPVAV